MDEALRSEIESRPKTLQFLKRLLPKAREIAPGKANREMNKLISQEFEPYLPIGNPFFIDVLLGNDYDGI
jgi:hypothetical protein